MNGIFLAASCLGALVTIAVAEPRMQELKAQARQTEPRQTEAEAISLTPSKLADTSHDKGSMTTKTVVDVDRSGKQTVTEERVIAFQD